MKKMAVVKVGTAPSDFPVGQMQQQPEDNGDNGQ
jgi:hypothetical protein